MNAATFPKLIFFLCGEYRAASSPVFTVNAQYQEAIFIFFLFPEFALLLRMNITTNNEFLRGAKHGKWNVHFTRPVFT